MQWKIYLERERTKLWVQSIHIKKRMIFLINFCSFSNLQMTKLVTIINNQIYKVPILIQVLIVHQMPIPKHHNLFTQIILLAYPWNLILKLEKKIHLEQLVDKQQRDLYHYSQAMGNLMNKTNMNDGLNCDFTISILAQCMSNLNISHFLKFEKSTSLKVQRPIK